MNLPLNTESSARHPIRHFVPRSISFLSPPPLPRPPPIPFPPPNNNAAPSTALLQHPLQRYVAHQHNGGYTPAKFFHLLMNFFRPS